MASRVEPEIIPPEDWARHQQQRLRDEDLERLASLLDDVFRIPGTNIRFGLDPLLGLLPALGDVIAGAVSLVLIVAAWERGLPRATIGRMLANIAIDAVLGALPLLGDLFDVAWKANRRNMGLLQRASAAYGRRQTWRDWLFLVGVVLAVAAVVAVPIVLVLWFFHLLRG